MADMTMPDGKILTGVPEGISQEEAERIYNEKKRNGQIPPASADPSAARAMAEDNAKPTSAGAVLAKAALSGYLNNLLGLPAFVAEMVLPVAPLHIPRSTDEWDAAFTARHDLAQKFDVPFDARGVFAGIDVVGQLLTGGVGLREIPEAFQQAVGEQQDLDVMGAVEHPIAEQAGSIFADIATLASARLPVVSLARKEVVRRKAMGQATPGGYRSIPETPHAPPIPPGLRNQIDRIVNSRLASGVGRSVLRSGEAGLEGAVLSVLQEGDPLMTMAFAAGGQAAGGAVLGMTAAVTTRPALLSAVAIGALAWQLVLMTTPGGDDNIIEATEKSLAKVGIVAGLGFLAAISGAGRAGAVPIPMASLTKNLPKIADTLFTAPRGVWLSLQSDISAARDSGDQTLGTVLKKFWEDPEYFGTAASVRISHAILNESVSLATQVRELMKKSPEFRSQFATLSNSSAFTDPRPSVNGPALAPALAPAPAPAPAPALAPAPPTGP